MNSHGTQSRLSLPKPVTSRSLTLVAVSLARPRHLS